MLAVKLGNRRGIRIGAANIAAAAKPIDKRTPSISTSRLMDPPDLSGRR